MPTENIVAMLITERDKLTRAIEALTGPAKRRGRPPKNPLAVGATAATPAPVKRKGPRFSAAQREAAAERMRQRWAAKRKAAAKPQRKAKPKA